MPITVDPDALAAAGVSLRDPVSVRLKATTVGKTLEAVLASRRLGFVAEAGRVLVTSPAEYRETLRPVSYTISDTDRRRRQGGGRTGGPDPGIRGAGVVADSRRTRLAAGRPGRAGRHADGRRPRSDHRLLREVAHRAGETAAEPARRRPLQLGHPLGSWQGDARQRSVRQLQSRCAAGGDSRSISKKQAGAEIVVDRAGAAGRRGARRS